MRNLTLRLAIAALLASLAACGPGVIDEGGGNTDSAPVTDGNSSGGSGSDTTGSAGGTTTTSGTGTGGTAPKCGVDTWTNYAQKEFANNCVSCHAFTSTLSGVQGEASQISSMVNGGEMPPTSPLDTNDIVRVVTWINCGLPN